MPPACTELTMQPWWVQTAVKHLNSPSVGWVTTTCWSGKILPPPTGDLGRAGERPGVGRVGRVAGVEELIGRVGRGVVAPARGQHGGGEADGGGEGEGVAAVGP